MSATNVRRTIDLALSSLALDVIQGRTTGVPDARVPHTELLLLEVEGARLLEERSASRGGSRLPTPVDTGSLLVTTNTLRFQGESQTKTWRWTRVTDIVASGNDVMIDVSSRAARAGVRLASGQRAAVLAMIEWNVSRSIGRTSQRPASELKRRIARLETHLNQVPLEREGRPSDGVVDTDRAAAELFIAEPPLPGTPAPRRDSERDRSQSAAVPTEAPFRVGFHGPSIDHDEAAIPGDRRIHVARKLRTLRRIASTAATFAVIAGFAWAQHQSDIPNEQVPQHAAGPVANTTAKTQADAAGPRKSATPDAIPAAPVSPTAAALPGAHGPAGRYEGQVVITEDYSNLSDDGTVDSHVGEELYMAVLVSDECDSAPIGGTCIVRLSDPYFDPIGKEIDIEYRATRTKSAELRIHEAVVDECAPLDNEPPGHASSAVDWRLVRVEMEGEPAVLMYTFTWDTTDDTDNDCDARFHTQGSLPTVGLDD